MGRTGSGQRDFLVDFKKLLAEAKAQDGDPHELALQQLREQDGRLLHLEGPPRDRDIIHRVRFPAAHEAELFTLLNLAPPTQQREELARPFAAAAAFPMPERWRQSWQSYCHRLAQAAHSGASVAPFSREDPGLNAELLALAPKLLAWQAQGEESLLRFASCVLCGNSKRLEQLAAKNSEGRHRGKLGAILEEVTGGALACLEDAGILETPRFALVHGPLKLLLNGQWLNLEALTGPLRLADADLERAKALDTTARRCLTVENETSFHELAKLRSGELLVCTSYPGKATMALLHKLPPQLEYWHFGDTDPEGFDILRDLRERTGRPFQSLHMQWRPGAAASPLDAGDRRLLDKLLASPPMAAERAALAQMLAAGTKGRFEQESLGKPPLKIWPFYELPTD